MDNKVYHECMQLTSQFKFCPNAFRIDLYRGCDFGCKYCFADMEAFNEVGTGLSKWRSAKIDDIKRKFYLAFETDAESKSVIVELLRQRVPLHCGGMSDPFQRREWTEHLTRQFIEVSNQYNYPVCFSTKTSHLPEDYFEILNPEIHAFQISIMGLNAEYVKKWETNTASPQERVAFVENLREQGFWCGVRIQPIIDIEDVLQLVEYCGGVPSYYSVEHLHVISDSFKAMRALIDQCTNPHDFTIVKGVTEFKHEVKEQNVRRIIETANKYGVKVGAADNDLHCMSQSRCCCGIDTINDNFSNYLKYNLTYMATGDFNKADVYIPQSNLRRHMNVGAQTPYVYYDDVVKKYVKNNLDLIPPKYRESVENQLFGSHIKKLF